MKKVLLLKQFISVECAFEYNLWQLLYAVEKVDKMI